MVPLSSSILSDAGSDVESGEVLFELQFGSRHPVAGQT